MAKVKLSKETRLKRKIKSLEASVEYQAQLKEGARAELSEANKKLEKFEEEEKRNRYEHIQKDRSIVEEDNYLRELIENLTIPEGILRLRLEHERELRKAGINPRESRNW